LILSVFLSLFIFNASMTAIQQKIIRRENNGAMQHMANQQGPEMRLLLPS